MKKFFFVLVFSSLLFSLNEVRAYTNVDLSNAEFLANQGIIVKQSTTAGYRLDNTITRAEVIGMALKIKGTILPDSYYCKNYFSDVKYNANNNWICRAVELAADAGLVSRTNTKFRPQDKITKAEALIILTKAGGIYEKATQSELPYIFDTDIDWQQELLRGVFGMQLLRLEDYKYTTKVNNSSGPISIATITTVTFYPNRPATRAEVFGFARNILKVNGATNNSVYENIFSADFGDDFSQTVDNNITYISFGEKVQALEAPIGILSHRYSLSIFNNSRFSYAVGDKFERMGTYKGKTYYVFNYSGMCNGRFLIFFAGNKIIKVDSTCEEEINVLLDGLEKINFDITSGYRSVNHSDILTIYYQLIDNQSTSTAYSMRSPAGVSEETFIGWYEKVTKVNFQENTLKDLGDNTYEFLVDMTENGIKSTYKVKSKVDLENFKINNISSVKQ